MRDKLNFWTDVPGRQVDTIDWKPGDTSAWLRFEDGRVIRLASENPTIPIRIS